MFQSNRLAKSQTKAICFDFCSSGCSAVDDPGDFVLICTTAPAWLEYALMIVFEASVVGLTFFHEWHDHNKNA